MSEEYLKIVKSIFAIDDRFGMPFHHIYHYTTPDVAIKILEAKKGGEFYCTHYRFLNDDKEFSWGTEIVLRWLSEQAKKSPDKSWIGLPDRVGEWILQQTGSVVLKRFTPWILSFSREMDSVSQWAAYTDRQNGGYAIGVNVGRLIEAIAPLRSIDERSIWILAPCVYVDIGRFDDEKKVAFSILDRLFLLCGGERILKSEDSAAAFGKLALLFASLIKNRDFVTEREWRVVHLTDDSFPGENIVFVGGKPRIPLLNNCSQEIVGKLVVSHHGNRERLKLMAEILAKKHDFKVEESKTSFVS